MKRLSVPFLGKRRNTMIVYRRLFSFIAATVAVVVLMAASAGDAWADGDVTCFGGPIASGVYKNLTIAGTCIANAGPVTVEHNLTVLISANLIAAFAGSNVTVGGNLDVQANGILILGCEPNFFTCFNDPSNTLSTTDTIAGNLTAENALTVLVHHSNIGKNVSLSGGGGGISCGIFPPALGGAPAYGDFEDNIIQGNLTITGWHSCWLGVIRDTITHNVNFQDNVTADPDGNEVATNSIGGNLNCTGNSPSPQIGDSGGAVNTVFGRATGQCNSPALVVH
jgi:hypothetical protein